MRCPCVPAAKGGAGSRTGEPVADHGPIGSYASWVAAVVSVAGDIVAAGHAIYGWPAPGAGAGKVTSRPVAPPTAPGPPQS